MTRAMPNLMSPDGANRKLGTPSEKERAARAALEARMGRALEAEEWGRARARLLQFASILRVWSQEIRTDESELPEAA